MSEAIQLATAKPDNGKLLLTMVVDGKIKSFTMSLPVAASMIRYMVDAIAKTAVDATS
jgi:hypothetical protein